MNAMLNVYFHVLDEVTRPIYKKLRDWRPKEIKLWLNREEMGRAEALPRDIRIIDHPVNGDDLCSYRWDVADVAVTQLFDGLHHLAAWQEEYPDSFICIDHVAPFKNRLVLFRDAVHRDDHPKGFMQVPCFNGWEGLLAYLESQGFFRFSLEDSRRFTRTNTVVQGAPVYRENSTGYYWYRDNFHKTHYEVFDASGNHHLGEADLDGNLDKKKKDRNKRIDIN